MTKTREIVQSELEALAERVQHPRALEIGAGERHAFDGALERARAQLVEELPPVLVVALAGGTGVGKSTLVNALAGAPIAVAGVERPTTTQIVVYHHKDVPLGGLPSELTWGARFVAHEREELRTKVLVDTPDLDSFRREHRERTLALLKSAGLVLYVFSPEKYLEERIWSVLREERRFSATAAVLNKADTLGVEELEGVTRDLSVRLAGAGLSAMRIFRTQATRHAGGGPGTLPSEAPAARCAVDDLPALRTFLEHELQAGDAARIVRENRRRTLSHLARTVGDLAPAGCGDDDEVARRFDELEGEVRAHAAVAGGRLVELLATELSAVEAELAPLATLRQHERFRGPFRAWLAVTDFATIGLAGLVDRLVGRPPRGAADVVQRVFGQVRAREVESLLRTEERALQDKLFERGLPVARWREIAAESDGSTFLTRLSNAVRERFEARSTLASTRGGAFVWTVSAIGGLVPAAGIFGGLYLLARDLFRGEYLGFGLFLHLAALTLLFFLALHAIVSVLLPTTGKLGRGLGLAAATEILPALFGDWLARYRADVEADLADLARPLTALAETLADEVALRRGDRDMTPSGSSTEASLAWPAPEERVEPAAVQALAPVKSNAPEIDPGERLLRALERRG